MSADRKKRLDALIRKMDDGMGIVRDIPDPSSLDRYAHFADGPHVRNVYTHDSPEPHPGYAAWERLLTYDLDDQRELWPHDPVTAAADL